MVVIENQFTKTLITLKRFCKITVVKILLLILLLIYKLCTKLINCIISSF